MSSSISNGETPYAGTDADHAAVQQAFAGKGAFRHVALVFVRGSRLVSCGKKVAASPVVET
jgi:hypothetical protein